MRDFIYLCAAHDEERDLVKLRDMCVIFIGKYFYSEKIEDVKESLAGILHTVALFAHVTGASLDETPPKMTLTDARNTLIEVWGRTGVPSLQVLMVYSALRSLIPAYQFDFEELKVFWQRRLETL